MTPGGRALLFERLLAPLDVPGRPEPFRDHDADGLRGSLERSLTELLNTRTPRAPRLGQPTVLDYGLADVADPRLLPAAMVAAIDRYEPRLTDVEVRVVERDERAGRLGVVVTGRLRGEPRAHRLAFRLDLERD